MNLPILRYFPWIIMVFPLCLPLANALAQDKNNTPSNGDDWLTYYYRNPRPDQTVAQLKAWSSEGTLQNDHARAPLTGFLSQVFRQNASQIKEWYEQIKDLPKADLEFISMAIWMSDTREGQELLKQKHPDVFDEKDPPDILTLKLDSASALDLLWGYFFATGDSKALRRIIAMFRFADAPKTVKGIPDGRKPFYTVLPEAAKWSLASNARQHPKVLQDCRKFLAGDELNETEKKWLDDTLQDAADNSKQQ